ncbi:MAG TPA: DUF4328 domain-containing protein [Micromonospora sp.]|nr:DUF4328 domain-containing protein [Micromonospora sp.]
MSCQTCGRETSPSDAYCLVCNTPPGAPAVRPGARTYAVRGVGMAACVAVALVVLLDVVLSLWPVVGRVMAERALRADDPELLNLAAASELIVALPSLAVYLAAAVLVIVWFYRARVNLDAFPGAGPTMAAGWAIGGWFVPFANFVIPCRVMANLARDSLWRARTPVLVGVWWAAWLFSQCGGWASLSDTRAYDALPSEIYGPDDYQAYVDYYSDSLQRGLPGTVAIVVAGVALIMLIRQISDAQQARIDRSGPAAPILPGVSVPFQTAAGGTSLTPPVGGGGTIGA